MVSYFFKRGQFLGQLNDFSAEYVHSQQNSILASSLLSHLRCGPLPIVEGRYKQVCGKPKNTLMVRYESYAIDTQNVPVSPPIDNDCVSRNCVGCAKPRSSRRFICPSTGPCLLYRSIVLSFLGDSSECI